MGLYNAPQYGILSALARHSANTASASGSSSLVVGMTRCSIGFDDELIYVEVSKPIENRVIPTIKLELPEADAVFAEWRAKADKIPY